MKYYREFVTEEGPDGQVMASELKQVSVGEVLLYAQDVRHGGVRQCDHRYVVDTPGFIYDIRQCAVCGKGLGTV